MNISNTKNGDPPVGAPKRFLICRTDVTTMTIQAFAKGASAALQRVMSGHESVVVKQGRRAVAVMLPPDVLQRLEDAADTREADRVYAEVKAGKVKVVPLA